VLSVPREEILRRAAEHKRAVHLRGKKRGPKPKQNEVNALTPQIKDKDWVTALNQASSAGQNLHSDLKSFWNKFERVASYTLIFPSARPSLN